MCLLIYICEQMRADADDSFAQIKVWLMYAFDVDRSYAIIPNLATYFALQDCKTHVKP